jgi:MscS family membrane protein
MTRAVVVGKQRLLLLATIVAATQSLAQEEAETATSQAPPAVVADEFDRGTPARSVEMFLKVAEVGDFETASQYLDMRNLRGEAGSLPGAVLAERLYVIANRANWVDVDELVDDPRGRLNDGLPSYRDSIGTVMHEDERIRLYVQRVPRDDGEFIWKVSNATVTMVPELYEVYGYSAFVEAIRARLPDGSFLGYELFKWVIALSVGVLTYLAFLALGLVYRRVADPSAETTRHQVYRFLIGPMALWATTVAMNAAATALGRGPTAEAVQRLSPVPTLITIWVLFAAVNLWKSLFTRHLEKQVRPGTIVLLRPVSNAAKLLILVMGALLYLDRIGIDITTVLAGLGVGGIAVALALQKPMEDVLGAITLYSQQPVRVGDFCRIGTRTGTIEEIGLRTTFVRTLANTRIAIPNAKLASEAIDNISARQKILYQPTLRLRYDASPVQVRAVLTGIRDTLENDARVLDGFRVRFRDIADDALLIEIFAYFDTTDWAEYLELVEDLNLRILEIVADAGSSLALPATTMKIEGYTGGEVTETAA